MKLLKLAAGVIALVAVLALAALFLVSEEQQVVEPENKTVEPTGPVAEFGDLIEIEFTLRLENGTVVDTTDPELAEKYNLKVYKKGAQKLILGQSGKVEGFDDAIVGMQEGESDIRVIQPSQDVLMLKINRTKPVHRYQPLRRKQGFKLDTFEKTFGKPPILNDIVYNFDIFPWKYKIINITEKGVIGEMYLKEGEIYQIPSLPWKSKVFQVYTELVTFYHVPEENMTIDTEFGKAKVNTTSRTIFINYRPKLGEKFTKSHPIGGIALDTTFKVIEVTDDTFTIQRWGILEDKTLEFEVKVNSIVKNVKEVKDSKIKAKENVKLRQR